ncbi:MAG TPA: hypothetical protein VKP30_26590 [Polyangiaceae bacterium]|nr:hypothetical protein [Polyangiaceae bacterium]
MQVLVSDFLVFLLTGHLQQEVEDEAVATLDWGDQSKLHRLR